MIRRKDEEEEEVEEDIVKVITMNPLLMLINILLSYKVAVHESIDYMCINTSLLCRMLVLDIINHSLFLILY